LTRSVAPTPFFEGGVKKRNSGSTLSKARRLGEGVEGLTPGPRPHIVKNIGIIQSGLGEDGKRAFFAKKESTTYEGEGLALSRF